MTMRIAYWVPVLSKALRQRDSARLWITELLAELATLRRERDEARVISAERRLNFEFVHWSSGLSPEIRLLPFILGSDEVEVEAAQYFDRRIPPPAPRPGDRICLYVCYARENTIPQHSIYAMENLRQDGFIVWCLAVQDDLSVPLPDPGAETADALIVRKNDGWDFGIWAATLKKHPELWASEAILFTNDSVIGPLRSMKDIWERIRSSSSDIFGMTESLEMKRHYQSYWMYYNKSALNSNYIRFFWSNVKSIRNKIETICNYEILSLSFFEWAGLRCEALFPASDTNLKVNNPTHDQWELLLKEGFPYIKVELLRDNPKQLDLQHWKQRVDATGSDGALAEKLFNQVIHKQINAN